MKNSILKIGKLYYETDGSREAFELELPPEDFTGELQLSASIQVKGQMMRVEEGIMVLLEQSSTEWKTICSHCGKALKAFLEVTDSEWLFYEQKPLDYDDENEFLFIDKHQMQIDLMEPLRQEFLLACPSAPRCAKACKAPIPMEESQPIPEKQSVKALQGLKDLISSK
jgi:uncharacterized metal-binding protein YceD (DUF177 family)